MDDHSVIASEVLWIPILGLGLLLILEYVVPLRALVQSRWLHLSTNLTIAGSNAVAVNALFGGLLAVWTQRAGTEGWGLLNYMGMGFLGNVAASVVLIDLVSYGTHRAYHRVPFLWRFHRAHHSDLDIDATTALRIHFGEMLAFVAVRAASIPLIGVSWLGLVAYEFVYQTIGLFNHSNVQLPNAVERGLRPFLVSPQMHWIHHSRRPIDHHRNFGSVFSFWDRLFGTYRMDFRREEIQIGLEEYPSERHATLFRFWAMPLDPACSRIALPAQR